MEKIKKKMDFPHNIMEKKPFDPGEVRHDPTPPPIAAEVAKCGLRILSFYEGVTSLTPFESIRVRTFSFCCVTQLIEGDGFWQDPAAGNARTPLRIGDWMLIAPGYPHAYGRRLDHFTEDSVAFDGPVARTLLRAGLFRSGIVRMGKERRLLPVIRALRTATLGAQLEAHALLLTLVLELCGASGEPASGNAQRIDRLLEELRLVGREWTVAEMAEYCNWSENHFRRLFQAHAGMSPKEFLDQRRYHRAMELLSTEKLSIAETAKRLGYRDPFYFSRRFRELSGMTPSAYRQRYARN